MPVTIFSAETGVDGANITTATMPSTIAQIGAGGFYKYDSTTALTGKQGYHIKAASGTQCYARLSLTSSKSQAFRGNFRMVALPTTNRRFFGFRDAAATNILTYEINSSGAIVVAPGGTGPTLLAGVDYDISTFFTVGAGGSDGALVVKVYLKGTNAQVGTTISSTTATLGASAAAFCDLGSTDSTATDLEYVWDYVRLGNDQGEFGVPSGSDLMGQGERSLRLQVGRLSLRETFDLTANISAGTDRRTLGLTGQESYPPLASLAALQVRQEDILGLQNRLVPIIFQSAQDHSGWYEISDVNTTSINWHGEVARFDWSLQAQRVGPENAVDLESRLAGIGRINDFGLTGERWHAPAGGSYAYYTGLSQPSGSVVRSTSDGVAVNAWRSVPASTNPRWTVPLAGYGSGRARVKVDGTERVAESVSLGASAWVLENGLVSASMAGPGASATFNIANFDGANWDSTAWNVNVGASAGTGITAFDAATILRNDYEVCTVRLIKDRNPGRTLLDLTLRRGSRFVEGYLQNDASNLLAVYLKTAQASTAAASTGFVVATSNDANGNKVIVGSARSFSGMTTQGGLNKAATTKLDFYVGAVVSGSAAAAGDAATVLNSHYLTSMSDVTLAALR